MDFKKMAADIGKRLSTMLLAADSTMALEDGTVITTNGQDPAVDVEIYGIDADGNQIPLEDGDYTMEDGTKFSVAANKIVSWGEFLQPTSEPGTADMADTAETPADQATEDTTIADLTERVTVLEGQVADLMNMINDLVTGSENMSKAINKLSKAPGGEPIVTKKKETMNAQTENTKLVEDFREFRKNGPKIKLP